MCSKFLVLALFALCEVISIQSLSAGAPGVCETIKQVKKTQMRWVTFSKMCGAKRCLVKRKRPISYTQPLKQLVCCKGYIYQANTDFCVPNCSTGCFGGRCIAPDVCVCDPPSYLHPLRPNTCLTPTCEAPCVNSQCVNQTCECLPEYQRFNSTHCYQCPPEHDIDANFNCVRHCDEGYALNGILCEPVCDCINGNCVAPNTCQCYEGYAKIGDKCEPICQCEGKCLAPNVCECLDGYRSVGGKCEPVCDECAHGECTEPNVCKCNAGFAKNVTSGQCYDCTKTCLNCVNGVCEGCEAPVHGHPVTMNAVKCSKRRRTKIKYT